ncbi:Chs5p-Arf1p-binding proteins-domain-containing protein, partial [Mycena albidolilacea]
LQPVDSSLAGFSASILTHCIPAIIHASIIGYFYWSLTIGYVNPGWDLRRVESDACSLMFSDFGELLTGIVTVRVFFTEKNLMDGLHSRINEIAFRALTSGRRQDLPRRHGVCGGFAGRALFEDSFEADTKSPQKCGRRRISTLLRAILYSDDPTHALDVYRKLDPITSTVGEPRFLAAAEALFLKVPSLHAFCPCIANSETGWQVGSDPEIQVASVATNHLTARLLKYFGTSGRYQQASNLFEKLVVREPKVSSLLVRAYLGMCVFLPLFEELRALQSMSMVLRTVMEPSSCTLLHAQCDFLREKGRSGSQRCVERVGDVGEVQGCALLTLNSCPMFTFNGIDSKADLARHTP